MNYVIKIIFKAKQAHKKHQTKNIGGIYCFGFSDFRGAQYLPGLQDEAVSGWGPG